MPRNPFRPAETLSGSRRQTFYQRWNKEMAEHWKLALRLIYMTFAAFGGVVAVIVRVGEGDDPAALGAVGWGGLITLIVAMVGSVVAAGLLMLPSDRITDDNAVVESAVVSCSRHRGCRAHPCRSRLGH